MGWMDGDMEEQKRNERTESFDPRMQQYFYGAANKLQNAFGNSTPNRNMQNAWKGIAGLRTPQEFNMARQAFTQANFSPNSYKPYMSPYAQNVTDIGLRRINEDANASLARAQLEAAQRGGGGGGSAAAIMAAADARNRGRNSLDYQTEQSQKAFEYANQMAMNNAKLALSRGQGLGELGTSRQNADLERLRALYAAGYSQYDLPRADAVRYAQSMGAIPYTKSSTDTEYGRSPSAMSQITGLLGSAASMYMGMPGQLGGGSLGGAFKNATNWWTGGGGSGVGDVNI